MCVIIYVPKNSEISVDELEDAWRTNPDGAGYSIQKNNRVYFKRGFMNKNEFISEILPLIGKYNLLLHFRISTSKAINKIQTHPYKKGDITLTEGTTKRPVICMNGIISGQKEYQDCNDTMSYIIDHNDAFSVINQDILNIIESDTNAKWAVMLPDKVLLSSMFEKENGRFYSNKNHLWKSYRTVYYRGDTRKKLSDLIKDKKIRKQINKNKELKEDLEDFIDLWCNYGTNSLCHMCTKCLKDVKSLNDVKEIINEQYYYEDAYDYEKEDGYETCSCNLYDEYNDYVDSPIAWWYDYLDCFGK